MSEVLWSANDDVIKAKAAGPIVGMGARGIQRAAALKHLPPGVWWRVGRDLYFSRSKLIAWRDSGGTAAPSRTEAAA